jgi:hypothetical protein
MTKEIKSLGETIQIDSIKLQEYEVKFGIGNYLFFFTRTSPSIWKTFKSSTTTKNFQQQTFWKMAVTSGHS